MSYHDHWKLLAARLRGLSRAGEMFINYSGNHDPDGGGIHYLQELAQKVTADLDGFSKRFSHSLPADAKADIDAMVSSIGPLVNDQSSSTGTRRIQVGVALLKLAGVESELTYALSSDQERIRSRLERAFAHLQRLLVVDAGIAANWRTAFQKGERACEQLGGVQLLHHGIWAYKIDAAGERTDLVFQEPAREVETVEKFADGMVLTEWKVASAANAAAKFAEARAQAKRYASGALSGTDLTNYRYAVVVTEKQVGPPPNIEEGQIIFRHLNIAIDPNTPSIDSKRV